MKKEPLRKSTRIILGIALGAFVIAILLELLALINLTLFPNPQYGWALLNWATWSGIISLIGFVCACVAAGFIRKDGKTSEIPGAARAIEMLTLLQIPIVIGGFYLVGDILENTTYNYSARIEKALDKMYGDYEILARCNDFGYGYTPGSTVKIQTSLSSEPILVHFSWSNARPGNENVDLDANILKNYCSP